MALAITSVSGTFNSQEKQDECGKKPPNAGTSRGGNGPHLTQKETENNTSSGVSPNEKGKGKGNTGRNRVKLYSIARPKAKNRKWGIYL